MVSLIKFISTLHPIRSHSPFQTQKKEATKSGLLKMGINLEGYGGDVQCVPISALHGTNLDHLADAITTQATLMDLKSEYTGLVEGVVIESKTDPHRGYFILCIFFFQ